MSTRLAICRRAGATLVAWAIALLVVAGSARAETIAVSNTNDAGNDSLRAAIEAANADTDLDIVDATGVAGTINLQTALPILSEDIELRGPGASTLTVRRGAGVMAPFRIFLISVGVGAEISGLTIASGNVTGFSDGGAGIYNNRGNLTLRDSVVTQNVNTAQSNGANGGGILNSSISQASAATMTIVDSAVSGIRLRATGPESSTRATAG